MDQLRVSAAEAEGSAGGLRLKFKGPLRQLIASGRKSQPSGRSEQQQDVPSPSQGMAVSDSPGHPFSPSSAEPSPAMGPAAAAQPAQGHWASARSVHGRPPGKQPHPDDVTPGAEAVRARLQRLPEASAAGLPASEAAEAVAGTAAGGPASGVGGQGATAGARSVFGQPPGKQPHPDDPLVFAPGGAGDADGGATEDGAELGSARRQLGYGDGNGGGGAAAVAGPRGVAGRPPGKQPYQIAKIEEVYQSGDGSGGVEEEEEPSLGSLQAHWQQQQRQQLPHTQALQQQPQHQQQQRLPSAPGRPQQHAAAAAAGAHAPAFSMSGHQEQQQHPSAAPGAAGSGERAGSRKRPASQVDGEGGQRKKAANGAAAASGQGPGGLQRMPTGVSSSRPLNTGVPASLARGGGAGGEGGVQHIRPMPGAPRSLQQRQQLLNSAVGGARPAGAPRPKQPAGAPKPKQPPKQQAKPAGGGQRRASTGGAAAGGAPAHAYKPGDVVWAKIGVYPWWPAQLQRPTLDEHFKPKHAPTDLFCVFYGSNDYNWLPATALKPFTETHPDYAKHANIKNKALQRAIDEAWVYGMQRQRPDVSFGPGYGGGS